VIRLVPATRSLPRLLLLCVLAAGCAPVRRLPTGIGPESGPTRAADSRAVVGTDPGDGHSYPLATGNRWIYSGYSYKWMGVPGTDTTATRTRWMRRDSLTYRVTQGGREYFRLESFQIEGAIVNRRVSYLRQDRSGLFEADAAYPPGSEVEHLMLPYPTHSGASWPWPPAAEAVVEGREVVETPLGRMPAWRVRLNYTGTMASTVTRMWFGACGLVGTVSTTDRAYVNREGEHIVYHAEQCEWLSAVSLVELPTQVLGVVSFSDAVHRFDSSGRIRPYVGYYPGAALFDQSWLDTTQVGRVLVATADTDPDFVTVASQLSNGISDVLNIGVFQGGVGTLTGAPEAQWFDLAGPDFAPAHVRRITLRLDSLSFAAWPSGGPCVRYAFTITVEGTRARGEPANP